MNDDNVFINCPFDNEYFELLKPLLFTLIYLKLKPQISETSDSGETRLHKIKQMMAHSKYSIHDLSRMEPLNNGDLPRFNMPFECGIDFGIRLSDQKFAEKTFLILEKEQYRYQKVISDISGNDIKSHNNDPQKLIQAVRNWFKLKSKHKIPGHQEIWLDYREFIVDYEEEVTEMGYNPKKITELTFQDLIESMESWIESYQTHLKER